MTGEPTVFSDPVFGALNFYEKYGWFEGKADWLGQPIRVSFIVEVKGVAQAIARAHPFWFQREVWADRMRANILEKYLPLKNESWLADNEAPVSEAEFLSRLQPEGVTFYMDGEPGVGFEFFFTDGELFCGHSIVVSGEVDGTIQQISLAG